MREISKTQVAPPENPAKKGTPVLYSGSRIVPEAALGLQVSLGGSARDPGRLIDRVGVPEEFLKIAGSPRDVHAHDRRRGYRYDRA